MPNMSGVTGIVRYKCVVIYVKDIDLAIRSYEALGLKLKFKHRSETGGFVQASFFLSGGGLIELVGPMDPNDDADSFVRFMAKRGDGFKHLTLDGSAGCVDLLNARGVRTQQTDPQHTEIHRESTLTRRQVLQLTPVGMGTPDQVDLGGNGTSKL